MADEFRTACHGCRGMAHETRRDDSGRVTTGFVLLPGDGTIMRTVASTDGEATQLVTCPVCDGSGWLPGFQPPV